jgi:hypothetical protein
MIRHTDFLFSGRIRELIRGLLHGSMTAPGNVLSSNVFWVNLPLKKVTLEEILLVWRGPFATWTDNRGEFQ